MNIFENIRIALTSLKTNFLRSLLTLLIIAVGITCLVGILTAIDAILFSMSDSFNRIGANSFSIVPKRETLQSRQEGRQTKRAESINFNQAMEFKERYKFPSARIAVSTNCTRSATVKYGEESTNPTILMEGIDENYLDVSAYELEIGRNFTLNEVHSGGTKVIIGSEIVKLLFENQPQKALGEVISINSQRYRVIGVLKSKGASMDPNIDRRVLIPLIKAKQLYGYARKNYSLAASVSMSTELEDAISQATGTMRNVRVLTAGEENDFEMRTSQGLLDRLKEITTELRLGTIAIALMTLLGAAIGLMNIMLVSVTERTREIGIRKALGATKKNILIQFLTEAIVICQIGGMGGIILGIVVGNIVSILIESSFIIPWAWIILGISVCIFVGIVSGLYPALKAAQLDPIDALRYE